MGGSSDNLPPPDDLPRDLLDDDEPSHASVLRQGVKVWNQWREANPNVQPYLIKADFRGAKLRGVNLKGANLQNSQLRKTDLREADLSNTNLSNSDLRDANLRDANFRDANLSLCYFVGADLSGAKLNNANLRVAQALHANFNRATLTGACIQNWNINSYTNLQDVICEYVFTEYDPPNRSFDARRPRDPNQIFVPGEFSKRYRTIINSVELFFNDGIDWTAFLASLQELKIQYGDDVSIQDIGKRGGGSFLVRLEVPAKTDLGMVERRIKELYDVQLQLVEAQYRSELYAKDQEIEIHKRTSADILELAKLAASRPINVEAKAVSSSDTFNTNLSAPVGNYANKMQDNASQQATQYIGASADEIAALIASLRGLASQFPPEQQAEVLDHLGDIETEAKAPPEKRKVSRIKGALLALGAAAAMISGGVTQTNEFVTQVQELSEKLGHPIKLEQMQPQAEEVIDVQALDAGQP